jgi:hypothetical protein
VNEKKEYRTIIFYKNYFLSFFEQQNFKVKTKISWTLDVIAQLDRVPETYLKHL